MYYDNKGQLITGSIKGTMLYDKSGNFKAFNPIDKTNSDLFKRLTGLKKV
jgi:hypothetical protein